MALLHSEEHQWAQFNYVYMFLLCIWITKCPWSFEINAFHSLKEEEHKKCRDSLRNKDKGTTTVRCQDYGVKNAES